MPVPQAPAGGVAISHRDRVIYPEAGITKGELADYYHALAPALLRWLANRPVSLVRCPQGRARKCFFQKHDTGGFGPHVHHVAVREKDGTVAPYLYVDTAEGVLACVQMGTIEFHGWGSLARDIEKPDRMVFDLDPDEGLGFGAARQAAEEVRGELATTGLASWPMLTGGKGVHVVVPLRPDAAWPEVRAFAERFSRALAGARPERFTASPRKASRKGRIFIDYLRNQRGSTAILPYSARAREGAPVAAPVTWDELRGLDSAHAFTVRDTALLLERAGSRALADWAEGGQPLPGA
ncbi:non-homologous end-joining DNA ligase [Sphingomonas canadensis]|uniref:Non-homologous end-joining DNA ligase n=1 Tax=Sphingomonas canadensis TaxID=1219257 RepID=A0ABW3H4L2_9SPHN